MLTKNAAHYDIHVQMNLVAAAERNCCPFKILFLPFIVSKVVLDRSAVRRESLDTACAYSAMHAFIDSDAVRSKLPLSSEPVFFIFLKPNRTGIITEATREICTRNNTDQTRLWSIQSRCAEHFFREPATVYEIAEQRQTAFSPILSTIHFNAE
jgi:hypothetical protein